LGFYEFFYRTSGQDVGFDPEFPATPDDYLRIPTKNALNWLAFDAGDWCISPTQWQASTYPQAFRDKMSVIFDGVDCDRIAPSSTTSFEWEGKQFRFGDELLTFVNRNLEPYRGYHRFMRALPSILSQRPEAQVLLIGGDQVSYGRPPPGQKGWKDLILDEVKDQLDMSRVHFMGRVSYDLFLKVLQVSRTHVYFTYPFVQSWSMVEAMASGCHVIASDTAPCKEFIEHGKEGLLVPFFDQDALIASAVESLAHPGRYLDQRHRARERIVRDYDLKRVCLPGQVKLLENLLNNRLDRGLPAAPWRIDSSPHPAERKPDSSAHASGLRDALSRKDAVKQGVRPKSGGVAAASEFSMHIRCCAMAPDFMDVRVRQPLQALCALPGVTAEIHTRKLDISPPRVKASVNVLIIQRIIPQEQKQWLAMLEQARQHGWLVVSEWDDHPAKLPPGVRERFKRPGWLAFRGTHALQTSTPFLKDALSVFNPHTALFENAVATALPTVPQRQGQMRVFFGALNREGDWAPMIDAIGAAARALAERGTPVHFDIVHDKAFFERLKAPGKQFHGTLNYADYLKRLEACDFALLPLADNFNNRCKSDLKAIEAGSRGVAVIASSPIYERIQHGENGLLAASPEDWARAFLQLAQSRETCARLAANALRYVKAQRMESMLAKQRFDTYRKWYAQRDQLHQSMLARCAGDMLLESDLPDYSVMS
jgi:glycosyltransferase involved in cell wall biosynthesis